MSAAAPASAALTRRATFGASTSPGAAHREVAPAVYAGIGSVPVAPVRRTLLVGGADAHGDEPGGVVRTLAPLGAAGCASAVGEQGWIPRGSEPGAG